MNTLTTVVIVIFLALIIVGYSRGLIKSVLRTVLTLVSIVVAYFLAPVASEFVCANTTIDNYFDDIIYETVQDAIGDSVNERLEGVVGSIPDSGKDTIADIAMKVEPTLEQQEEFIESLDIPDFAKKMLKEDNNAETRKSLGVQNFYHFISAYVARMIVNALTFLCVFALVYIVMQIVIVAAGIISHLPIINGANRIGGAVFGGVEAVIILWVFFLVVAITINTDFGKEIYLQIEESSFLQGLYDANIFLPLVTKM